MSFIHYKNIKNKICLIYYGNSPEYLIQLRLIRPFLQAKYPEIDFTFACKSQYSYYLKDDSKTITIEQYEKDKTSFAYTIPIIYDASTAEHPIMKLLKESNIPTQKYETKNPISQNGFICPEGNYPIESLNVRQVSHLRSWIQNRGFKPLVIGTAINQTHLPVEKRPTPQERTEMARTAGFVVGVECDMIYEAIAAGIPTALISTENNAEFYKTLCDKPIILKV